MFKNVNIGQRVWSCCYGFGVIKDICHKSNYQISVSFDINDRRESYTTDGKWSKEAEMQELYLE